MNKFIFSIHKIHCRESLFEDISQKLHQRSPLMPTRARALTPTPHILPPPCMADIAGSYPSLGAYRVILLGAEPWSTGALSLTPHIALSSLTGVAVGLPILPTHRRVDFKADLART